MAYTLPYQLPYYYMYISFPPSNPFIPNSRLKLYEILVTPSSNNLLTRVLAFDSAARG